MVAVFIFLFDSHKNFGIIRLQRNTFIDQEIPYRDFYVTWV